MKVVILCGGKGTRLGEVTGNTIPKPMALVGEDPILVHIMRSYARHGFTDFILCAGHLSWTIKSYFLNYHARRCDVTVKLGSESETHFLPYGHQDENWTVTIAETGLETATAGRLKRIMKYIAPGESFMLTYGDGVADVDLSALAQFHAAHGKLITMTGVVPPGRFGELSLQGDRVSDWAEKPTVTDRYINGGFMVVQRKFLEDFVADKADDVMLESEPLAEATAAGELMLYRHGGFWQCMDTARDWSYLNDLWTSGTAPWALG